MVRMLVRQLVPVRGQRLRRLRLRLGTLPAQLKSERLCLLLLSVLQQLATTPRPSLATTRAKFAQCRKLVISEAEAVKARAEALWKALQERRRQLLLTRLVN